MHDPERPQPPMVTPGDLPGHREDIGDAGPGLPGRKNSGDISKADQQHLLGGIKWALGPAR